MDFEVRVESETAHRTRCNSIIFVRTYYDLLRSESVATFHYFFNQASNLSSRFGAKIDPLPGSGIDRIDLADFL